MMLLVVIAVALQTLLDRSMQLAAEKKFSAAEEAARVAVRQYPQSLDAKRQLGFVLLWEGKYAEARRAFGDVLRQQPRDARSRAGLAQSRYWTGDPRGALRDFERVLELEPSNAEARRAVEEIRSAMRPGFTTAASAIDDDQPYRSGAIDARVFFFSDPLTKWEILGGGAHLDARGDARSTRHLGLAGETTLPSIRTRIQGQVQRFTFPDGDVRALPSMTAERRLPKSVLRVSAERRPLLRSASALRTHPYGDVLAFRWSNELFSAGAESIRYFDHNRGWSADGYVLVPWRRVSAGGSLAYRDTDESRFRFDSGTYDPYYTPQNLAEARAVLAYAWTNGRLTASTHVDGGIGRERGTTFHPWRAAVSAAVRLTPALTVSASAAHESTIFYNANEISTGLAGRF
jgi:tetratricopeptide (TPR) repeat protein